MTDQTDDPTDLPSLTVDDFEIVEWDRRSPINGVSVPDILTQKLLHPTEGYRCPYARLLMIRERKSGVAVFLQHTDIRNNNPLERDDDVERMKVWLREERLPNVLAHPEVLLAAAMKARELAQQQERRRAELLRYATPGPGQDPPK